MNVLLSKLAGGELAGFILVLARVTPLFLVAPLFSSKIMPPQVRTAGVSLAFSLATAVFGGFTPLVSTALIQATGDRASPAFWLMLAAAASIAAALALYSRAATERRR